LVEYTLTRLSLSKIPYNFAHNYNINWILPGLGWDRTFWAPPVTAYFMRGIRVCWLQRLNNTKQHIFYYCTIYSFALYKYICSLNALNIVRIILFFWCQDFSLFWLKARGHCTCKIVNYKKGSTKEWFFEHSHKSKMKWCRSLMLKCCALFSQYKHVNLKFRLSHWRGFGVRTLFSHVTMCSILLLLCSCHLPQWCLHLQ